MEEGQDLEEETGCLRPALFNKAGHLPPVQLRVYASPKASALGPNILTLDPFHLEVPQR